MDAISNLISLRDDWVTTCERTLATRKQIRQSVHASLERFFDLLTTAIESKEPHVLDAILEEWIRQGMRVEIEPEQDSVTSLLERLLLIMYTTIRDKLTDAQALELMGNVLPVFTHAFQFTSRLEGELKSKLIAAELEEAHSTLEKLDASKSQFISIAAHELKTPLTLIQGYNAMIREQLGDAADKTIEELLHGIEKGSRRLEEIVNDMIDISLIDNNLLALNFQPVWLNHILERIKSEFAVVLAERQLTLEIQPFPGSEMMTYADGERLTQVFRNLVANAIKYTPDGGRITVDGRILPGFLEITVSDTGIGIDPEDQTRIFEKFGRVGDLTLHSSSKTKFKGGGPGLGLPIAKGVIEAHGGAIWVESEGRDETRLPGTTFHVLLPIRQQAPEDYIAQVSRAAERRQSGGNYPGQ